MPKDFGQLVKSKMAQTNLLLFLVVTVWWLFIKPFNADVIVDTKHLWSAVYGLIPLFGGVFGLIISRRWGGYKSLIGKAVIYFSIGLFLQFFGQVVYNYYTLFAKIEAPYPSLGDLGYFGSIPAYIYGVLLLGRAAGFKVFSRATGDQVLTIVFPLLMLGFSYSFFLRDYQLDLSQPLTTFLDFGYPLGQAIYVSLALLVLFVSRKFLGGIMKKPVLLLLLALVVQYLADFNFLYQASHGNWYAGGWGDYLYSVSYFVMTLAIIYMGNVFTLIHES